MNFFRAILTVFVFVAIAKIGFGQATIGQATMESELGKKPGSSIAQSARILGNPQRGALIFYRQGLACRQCHTIGKGDLKLGPDLSRLGERATAEHIIESIMEPSKKIGKGYKPVTITFLSGRSLTGIIKEDRGDKYVFLVPGEDKLRLIPKDSIDEETPGKSLMPAGLVNQLAEQRDFFDLVSFLLAIGKDPTAIARLQPSAEALKRPPLPLYESQLDHAGIIVDWNQKSFKKGKQLYESLCINCHGDKEHPGSLPNALRFASGKFRNGHDPYSMYKTITLGYRMMLPQRQLVPQQKYDVIHYIREEYLKKSNPNQYSAIGDGYLEGLPKGKSRGPVAEKHEPWRDMDYGPFLIGTYEIVNETTPPRPTITAEEKARAKREARPAEERWPKDVNFAYKGIALRVGGVGDEVNGGIAGGKSWTVFDHDTMRLAGAWSGPEFMDWQGIMFNGRHAISPRITGKLALENPIGPGWANPMNGSFTDPRFRGRDGRPYGPLPRTWAHYKGLYKHGNKIVVSYTVGLANILETSGLLRNEAGPVWTRTLNIGRSPHDLVMRIAPADGLSSSLIGLPEAARITKDGFLIVKIAAKQTPVNFAVLMSRIDQVDLDQLSAKADISLSLSKFTKGGPAQWPQELETTPSEGPSRDAFTIDVMPRPLDNPWKSRLRMTGLDFFPDGKRLVACCWDGDVWIVAGIDDLSSPITWRRIASGLFQPLGIKIVGDKILVGCRDQIAILRDLNGDGETDFYESFNSDHQVTDHFHEFAMGLQSDKDGNIYYAKSARHARRELVPHHGTLLKVTPDGARTEILANGFRAANGVCINGDGTFFVTDQEGHWTPMNRINRVEPGGFYGNMYSYGAPEDSSDSAMELPMFWANKKYDRSPSELLWVDSKKWGALNGKLLNLSFGYGKIFVVPHEKIDGQWQGGMSQIPLPQFPTGVMRARFHPTNGQMYACGMRAWGSNQISDSGGLYRIRYTGKPMYLPIGLNAKSDGMQITFSEPLDVQNAEDVGNYLVETWKLKRSANYGSPTLDEQVLRVESATVSADGCSVRLKLNGMRPTWCMQIGYRLKSDSGKAFNGVIQNTVYKTSK
jgi:putative heme-binding domain-containing protein